MATARDGRVRSLADFLAWEQQQPERHERVAGAVRMMTGGTFAHNRITRNCARALENRLSSDCEVFTSDIKVVTPAGDVMYPDVVVICGAVADRATWSETPVAVVEVLSTSTAERDRGPKRVAYQTIASLRHYVLIDQNKPTVDVASRSDDGSWRGLLYEGLDARLRLDALGVELGLDEIFARVTFAPVSPDQEAEAPNQSR
jgi:Uma2 family endonuclease